ncbi:MAG: 23S rRNA (pseudouridine(1915)-N(3))-methyltransferase RlmH [Gemmatimonadota bacterium]|nr:MAG: 23S rRNA (pseudouridine(1915)-N(3))-methyltransferase RlmH [Gemmatimonadota bacterium]
MIVRVVAVGRVKDAALRELCDAYAARVRRYQHLEIREVREAGRRDRDAAAARRREGEALLATIPQGSHVVALTRGGEAKTSEELAALVEAWRERARDVAFVVGGAHGLDAALLDGAHLRLALSDLTLPHELARLVLLEQLYRAMTILRGEPYHKGSER